LRPHYWRDFAEHLQAKLSCSDLHFNDSEEKASALMEIVFDLSKLNAFLIT